MSGRSGFTLIEVLVAAGLVAIVLAATATMMLTAYGTLDRSGEQTAAITLNSQRMEWLRNQPFASGALAAGTSTEVLAGTYAGYTRTTTVADGIPRAGVKQVTISTATPCGIQVAFTSLIAG